MAEPPPDYTAIPTDELEALRRAANAKKPEKKAPRKKPRTSDAQFAAELFEAFEADGDELKRLGKALVRRFR